MVMKMKHQLIIRCEDRAKALEWPGNTGAFQIVQFVSGHGITIGGNGLHVLSPGDLCCTRPGEMRFWSVAENATVNYFRIWPEYLMRTPHVGKLLRSHPAFLAQPVFSSLSTGQSEIISMLFREICDEAESNFDDKNEVILLHLQMMMLHLQRFNARRDTFRGKAVHNFGKETGYLRDPMFDEANFWIYN